MTPRQTGDEKHSDIDVIARNNKARFEYEILERHEAGMALVGSEVKSLRNREVSINEAFARPRDGELWLLNMNVKPYNQANVLNHEPTRPRKVLMRRNEINRLTAKVGEKGLTIVVLLLYWKHGIAKAQLALVRGRRRFDKREAIRTREAKRDILRASRRSRAR